MQYFVLMTSSKYIDLEVKKKDDFFAFLMVKKTWQQVVLVKRYDFQRLRYWKVCESSHEENKSEKKTKVNDVITLKF